MCATLQVATAAQRTLRAIGRRVPSSAALGALVRDGLSCDVCDGLSAQKLASGEVLDISNEGLLRLVPAHGLVALLLFRPWDARAERLQRAFDGAAVLLRRDGVPIVMAQIGVHAFPTQPQGG